MGLVQEHLRQEEELRNKLSYVTVLTGAVPPRVLYGEEQPVGEIEFSALQLLCAFRKWANSNHVVVYYPWAAIVGSIVELLPAQVWVVAVEPFLEVRSASL